MSEYEVNWLTDFPLIIYLVCSQKSKQTSNYKEKLVILQSIGIIAKETRMITNTCRYSSAHLIPIIQSCQDELGIKCPLEDICRRPLFPYFL